MGGKEPRAKWYKLEIYDWKGRQKIQKSTNAQDVCVSIGWVRVQTMVVVPSSFMLTLTHAYTYILEYK